MKQNALKQARKAKGFKQKEIASLLGITWTEYNRIENGKVKFRPVYVYALCYLLDLKPWQLREYSDL